jgi:AcrR family transcriptional regulator
MTHAGSTSPRREALIAAGLQLLDELPQDQITMNDVAERAGVARGLVFYYFASKEGFETELATRFYDLVKEAFSANTSTQLGEAILIDIGILLDLSERHPGAMRATSFVGRLSPLSAESAESVNLFTIDHVKKLLGVEGSAPFLEAAIGSWGIMAVDLALRWLSCREISRPQIQSLLMAQFRAMVETVRLAEPHLRISDDLHYPPVGESQNAEQATPSAVT